MLGMADTKLSKVWSLASGCSQSREDLPVLESGMMEMVFVPCSLPLRPLRHVIHLDGKEERTGMRTIHKAATLRKVFILEQPRICSAARIQKSLFSPTPSNSKAQTAFLDPGGAYYLILPHLQVKRHK